jgi:DNA-binding CsgD family transcriptional regulator
MDHRREGEAQAMTSAGFDDLVSLIYDAALDERQWGKVVIALAGLTDCGQASFEWHDHDTDMVVRQAPLTDPAFHLSFHAHYGQEFSLLRRTLTFPVGRVLHGREFIDYEWMGRTAYFNEWWKPQGVGGGSLFANLAIGSRAAVLVTVCKYLDHDFSAAEWRLFAAAAGHMARAVDIHARMQLAAMLRPASEGELADIVLVDADARILKGDDNARHQLHECGLVDRLNPSLIVTPDNRIERLVRCAAKAGSGEARAGSAVYRRADGNAVEIIVFPCPRQSDTASGLLVERPAALLQVTAPGDRRRARIARLVARHGLTRAEAAVAIEIATGDGRAAAAARLGIRETTVRSHLTAIFDKLDIHRQAELARLVAGD